MMLPLPQQPLPLATTSAFTPLGTHPPPLAGEAWRRAWAGAMAGGQQAQATAGPTERVALASDPSLSSPVKLPAVSRGAAFMPHQVGSWPVAGVQAMAMQAPPLWTVTAAFGAMPPAATERILPGIGQPIEAETGDTAPPAKARHVEAPVSRDAVRVHVEPHAGGLAVWLGIDGDAAATAGRAAAVLCELRRTLQGSGQRLALLVCNGVAIDPTPRLSKEKP